MNREIYSIKGNPRQIYKAPGNSLTLAVRLRLCPTNRLSCGNQPANIRLVNRRVKFPFSFHHYIFGSFKKRKKKHRFDLDRVAHHIRFPSDQTGKNVDREQVKKMYHFIFERVNELKGNLQLIIVDHARFNEDDVFMDSVVEDWHEDDNLIPKEWYTTE